MVQPDNLHAGNGDRQAFIKAILQQNDDEYIAYCSWCMNPSARASLLQNRAAPQGMISYVRSHPGAIGSINEKNFQPAVRVLLTIP